LRALRKLTGRGSVAELSRLGTEIGSDVPLFLFPGPVILEGRGERVRKAAPLPPLWALLVKPALEIRAAEAYRLLDATGPDHEKSFRIEVWVDGELLGIGEGPSRRTAETAAAAQALELLRRTGAWSGPDGTGAWSGHDGTGA
jgi:hypothetical protein